MNLFDRFRQASASGTFLRSVLFLTTGTAASQVITVAATPVLTRLYSPEEYGLFSLFTAVTTVLLSIAAAKYEWSVMLPKRDEDGAVIVVLCVLISGAVAAGMLAVSLPLSGALAARLGDGRLAPWLHLLAPLVVLGGTYNALSYWNSRKGRFGRLATIRFGQNAITAGTNLGLGAVGWGVAGLMLGSIVGQVVGTGAFVAVAWREDRHLLSAVTVTRLKELAREYADFPRYSVPTDLVAVAASQLPLLMISQFFGSTTLGLFSLAWRMVNLPMALLAESVRGVFFQAAAKDFAATGSCRPLLVRTVRHLGLFAIVPFGALAAIGPALFRYVFGEVWGEAGHYTRVLAVMVAVRFVVSPIGSVLSIAGRQRSNFVIQTTALGAIVVGLWFAHAVGASARAAVAVFSGIYVCKYLVELAWSYRASCSAAFNGA